MEFINRGGSIKMRKGSLKDYRWRTLHKGEKMETTKFSAENNGLEEVKTTESSIGNVGVLDFLVNICELIDKLNKNSKNRKLFK